MRRVLSWPQQIWKWLKSHWKLSLFVLLLVTGIGYWQYQKTQAAKPELKFTKPEIGNLVKTLQVSGVLDAEEKATMRFAAGGKVVYLGAQEGDFIEKGKTIATIDRRELEKRMQQDLNAYMRERWDWEQTLDDTKDRALPEREQRTVDKYQWDLTDTVLNVEIRDIAIRNTVLSAPFSGVLVSSPTSVTGVNLAVTDAFELVNPDTLIFRAGVDEADIGLIKIDQPATIELDSFPDLTIPTGVTEIALKSSQSTSGTVFAVEFPIGTGSGLGQYRLGMNGEVTIVLDTRDNVLHIPLDAVRQRDDKVFVDVRTGPETYQEREIEIGLETDESVEVIKGLSKDDEVLLPT